MSQYSIKTYFFIIDKISKVTSLNLVRKSDTAEKSSKSISTKHIQWQDIILGFPYLLFLAARYGIRREHSNLKYRSIIKTNIKNMALQNKMKKLPSSNSPEVTNWLLVINLRSSNEGASKFVRFTRFHRSIQLIRALVSLFHAILINDGRNPMCDAFIRSWIFVVQKDVLADLSG